jgi:hypothetical protein
MLTLSSTSDCCKEFVLFAGDRLAGDLVNVGIRGGTSVSDAVGDIDLTGLDEGLTETGREGEGDVNA